ncbi:TPA: helix-turn-helix transcriptional regulator [Serratia marcescens]
MSIQLWNKGVYRQWTEKEDNTVIAMAGKFSPAEIGKAINRSKRAVHCRAQWLDVSLKYYAQYKPVIAACLQLRKKGKTLTEIAQMLGIPLGSVFAHLKNKR